jgi:large subunit ribosomal protein L25
MELALFKRGRKKSEIRKIRIKEGIPAVIYAAGEPSENVFLNKKDFEAILRKIKSGRLSTTVFTVKNEKKTFKVLVKEVQYHKTSYKILHVDFLKLFDDRYVAVRVPIECIGVEKCVGVKLGGALRQVVRYLKVECLPKDIPEKFEIDVSPLKIFQSRKLGDIDIPGELKPIGNLREVAVTVSKR